MTDEEEGRSSGVTSSSLSSLAGRFFAVDINVCISCFNRSFVDETVLLVVGGAMKILLLQIQSASETRALLLGIVDEEAVVLLIEGLIGL